MSPKTFLGWSLAAAAMLVAAIILSLGRPDVAKVRLAYDPVFPELRSNPDAVAITVVENTAPVNSTSQCRRGTP